MEVEAYTKQRAKLGIMPRMQNMPIPASLMMPPGGLGGRRPLGGGGLASGGATSGLSPLQGGPLGGAPGAGNGSASALASLLGSAAGGLNLGGQGGAGDQTGTIINLLIQALQQPQAPPPGMGQGPGLSPVTGLQNFQRAMEAVSLVSKIQLVGALQGIMNQPAGAAASASSSTANLLETLMGAGGMQQGAGGALSSLLGAGGAGGQPGAGGLLTSLGLLSGSAGMPSSSGYPMSQNLGLGMTSPGLDFMQLAGLGGMGAGVVGGGTSALANAAATLASASNPSLSANNMLQSLNSFGTNSLSSILSMGGGALPPSSAGLPSHSAALSAMLGQQLPSSSYAHSAPNTAFAGLSAHAMQNTYSNLDPMISKVSAGLGGTPDFSSVAAALIANASSGPSGGGQGGSIMQQTQQLMLLQQSLGLSGGGGPLPYSGGALGSNPLGLPPLAMPPMLDADRGSDGVGDSFDAHLAPLGSAGRHHHSATANGLADGMFDRHGRSPAAAPPALLPGGRPSLPGQPAPASSSARRASNAAATPSSRCTPDCEPRGSAKDDEGESPDFDGGGSTRRSRRQQQRRERQQQDDQHHGSAEGDEEGRLGTTGKRRRPRSGNDEEEADEEANATAALLAMASGGHWQNK